MKFKVTETPSLKVYSASIEELDLLHWVKEQSGSEKFYLKLRDESWEWAGSGNLFENNKMTFEDAYQLAQKNGGESLQIFMAHTFDLDPHKSRFILPRFEILKQNDRLTFKVNIWKDKEDADHFLNQVSLRVGPREGSKPNRQSMRRDSPGSAEWKPYFNKAQDFLEVHPKVVLARLTETTFENPVDPFSLLESLRQESYRCYLKLPNGEEIISVSPERLFKISGGRLFTEAVAGTKPRDADHKELLESKKERAEHQYVVDEILRQIEPFAEQIEINTVPIVVAFKKVLHLKTPISAQLKERISVFELIKALHPTPAVGGLPKKEALNWLDANEPFKREYYAAPIGVIGLNFAEFFVNIRSVLLNKNKMKLYSGVGVVKDSTADSEWNELDLKASQFWEALP